jgi:hypothetical protein
MVTIDELKLKFPVRTVAPYGDCIVIPGTDFDPDWELFLGDQGYKCFMTDLDRKPVMLVKLKGDAEKIGEREVYSQKSPLLINPWTTEEDDIVIKLWNENVLIANMVPSLPGRTKNAIALLIQRLEKYGKIEKRPFKRDMPLRKSSVKRWTTTEDLLLIDLWNKNAKVPDMLTHFPGRTRDSIAMHVDVLQQQGKIKPRWKAGEGKPHKTEKKPISPGPEPITSTASVETPSSRESTEIPESDQNQMISLLKEIRDLLNPQLWSFEYACPECGRYGSAVDEEKIWRLCPVCSKPLIVWNVEAS